MWLSGEELLLEWEDQIIAWLGSERALQVKHNFIIIKQAVPSVIVTYFKVICKARLLYIEKLLQEAPHINKKLFYHFQVSTQASYRKQDYRLLFVLEAKELPNSYLDRSIILFLSRLAQVLQDLFNQLTIVTYMHSSFYFGSLPPHSLFLLLA